MPFIPKKPNLVLEGLESLGSLGKLASSALGGDDPATEAIGIVGPLGLAQQAGVGTARKLIQAMSEAGILEKLSGKASPIKVPLKVLRDARFVKGGDDGIRAKNLSGGTSTRTKKELDALRESIRSEGIKNPVAIDINPSTGEAIVNDGTHRVLAASELGLEMIPVQFTPRSVERSVRKDVSEPIESAVEWMLRAGARVKQ